jgi:GT2 family glycosyltransferase
VRLVSIIIPTFNRLAELERCLESIGRMNRSGFNVELIIVNDGGAAPDDQRLTSLANGVELHLLSQPQSGPAAARNLGVRAARGDWFAFIDDDCLLPSDWPARVSDAIRRHPGSMIGGRTVNDLTTNAFSEASQTLVEYVYEYYNIQSRQRTPMFASNNMLVPAAPLKALGGFDERFRTAEDRELCRRWNDAGHATVYEPGVVVLHAHDLNMASMLRQHFAYGRGAFPYWEKKSGSLRAIAVEPFGFYLAMLSYPFRMRKRNALMLGMLIAASQIANAGGFVFSIACKSLRLSSRTSPARSGEYPREDFPAPPQYPQASLPR